MAKKIKKKKAVKSKKKVKTIPLPSNNFIIPRYMPPIRKPICPTFISDPNTLLIITVIGISLSLLALYKIMRYYNG